MLSKGFESRDTQTRSKPAKPLCGTIRKQSTKNAIKPRAYKHKAQSPRRESLALRHGTAEKQQAKTTSALPLQFVID